MSFRLTQELKDHLIGWLNREKDHLLSIDAMAGRIQIPRVTGTLDIIKADLEFVIRLRTTIYRADQDTEGQFVVELSTSDIEVLVDVAMRNKYPDRQAFWDSIKHAVEGE